MASVVSLGEEDEGMGVMKASDRTQSECPSSDRDLVNWWAKCGQL